MNQSCSFSSGLELANVVVSSDLLHSSWAAISDLRSQTCPADQALPVSVTHKAYPLSPYGTIISFVSSPNWTGKHLQGGGNDLVSSATLREKFPLFDFVCTKVNTSFSIHKTAIDLFASLHHELSRLKDQYGKSNPLIITGHSLGGSIASLFTLWLLDSISFKTRPICITFGSPLLGDDGFQRAILERPTWTSCFLHVVSNQDPIPTFFTPLAFNALPSQSTSQPCSAYKPFGTLLLCSESGCACFEDPELIMELLEMSSRDVGNKNLNMDLQIIDYGRIVDYLNYKKAIYRGNSKLGGSNMDPLRAGVTLELQAVGVIKPQQQLEINDMNALITKFGERLKIFQLGKKSKFDPSKELNDRKINMTYLEWYKKVTSDQVGYYDSFKRAWSGSRDEIRSREEIVKNKGILTRYWKKMVNEVEKMPQKEEASFRTRWLYAGTNYRRMVEPLDIADYYKNGKKDYIRQGRSEHYKLLEQWLNIDKPASNASERNKAVSLTEDSCFWARVEEAMMSCRVLKDGTSSPENKETSRGNLRQFEDYVMGLIGSYSVSAEIFLRKSSFMQWWDDYGEMAYNYSLVDFMKNGYTKYA